MKIKGEIGNVNLLYKFKNLTERTQLFLLGLPVIVMVFIFSYIPLAGWILSFFDYKAGMPIYEFYKAPFIGFKYFEMIFTNGHELVNSLINTLVFYFLSLVTSVFPVIFAIMLSEVTNTRFKRFVQSFSTLPNFVSWVIVFSITFSIFSNQGLLNQILMDLQIINKPTNLLGDSNATWIFQTCVTIWKTLGWQSIIYLAAITAINSELYDAAEVDGAGRLRKIIHITIPGIAPTFVVMLVLGISNLLSVGLEQYLVFYNGLVADKITVLDVFLYRTGILNSDYAYASAMSMSKSLISIALLFLANRLAKKIRGYGIV